MILTIFSIPLLLASVFRARVIRESDKSQRGKKSAFLALDFLFYFIFCLHRFCSGVLIPMQKNCSARSLKRDLENVHSEKTLLKLVIQNH
jgi:hypothetical protein